MPRRIQRLAGAEQLVAELGRQKPASRTPGSMKDEDRFALRIPKHGIAQPERRDDLAAVKSELTRHELLRDRGVPIPRTRCLAHVARGATCPSTSRSKFSSTLRPRGSFRNTWCNDVPFSGVSLNPTFAARSASRVASRPCAFKAT